MSTDKLKLKRQRARNTSFDLNRSSPHIREKYLKNNQQRRMPSPMDKSIIDMSHTIHTGKSAGAIPKNRERIVERMEDGEDLPRSLRDMVTESVENMRRPLDHSIRDIVNENVSRQLSSVHRSIALLSEAIRGLSIGHQVRQRENLPRDNDDVNMQHDRIARPNHGVNFAVNPPRVASPGEQNPPLAVNAPQMQYYGNRTRVERFGLKFNGMETHLFVESFVFRLEHCQRQYKIPWREILDDFHLLVSGQALDWYWLHVETTQVISWEGLLHALLCRFKTHRTNLDIMHELVERRQKPGENINDFFYHINLLRSKLEQPISEYEMIKLVKRNLRDSIGRIIYPIPVSSIEQLRIECVEAERNFARREERPVTGNANRRNLHEIQFNSSPEKIIETEEVTKELRCWNCQESGHGFFDSPSEHRRVFCYSLKQSGKQQTGRDFDGGITSCETNPKILNTVGQGQNTSFAKIRHYLPEDIRKANYLETRKKIFGEDKKDTPSNEDHSLIVPNKHYLRIKKRRLITNKERREER